MAGSAPERPRMDRKLLDILACPQCKGDVKLTEREDGLVCNACKLRYPIKDDIPIMLIDEAESVDDGEHQRLTEQAEREGVKPTFEE